MEPILSDGCVDLENFPPGGRGREGVVQRITDVDNCARPPFTSLLIQV